MQQCEDTFFQRKQLLQIFSVHLGKGIIKKEEHKHKDSVRWHYVATSCLNSIQHGRPVKQIKLFKL